MSESELPLRCDERILFIIEHLSIGISSSSNVVEDVVEISTLILQFLVRHCVEKISASPGAGEARRRTND